MSSCTPSIISIIALSIDTLPLNDAQRKKFLFNESQSNNAIFQVHCVHPHWFTQHFPARNRNVSAMKQNSSECLHIPSYKLFPDTVCGTMYFTKFETISSNNQSQKNSNGFVEAVNRRGLGNSLFFVYNLVFSVFPVLQLLLIFLLLLEEI